MAWLVDENKSYRDALDAMEKIINACAGVLSFERVLNIVLNQAIEVLGQESGSICMVDPDETLGLVAHRGLSQATIRDLTSKKIRIGQCLCGSVVQDKKPLILWNEEQVNKYATRESQRGEAFQFHAAFPLITRDTCHGVLCVFARGPKKPLEKQLRTLTMITRQAAMVIENTRLYEEQARKEHDVETAYADVFRAVTGDKLYIVTKEALMSSLGSPVAEAFPVPSARELAPGRAYLKNALDKNFPHLPKKDMSIFAVGEAMGNAVKHAGGCSLQVLRREELVQVLVSDKGKGIDFKDLPRATLISGHSTKKSLGVGFDVMLEFCDRLCLTSNADGTDLVLEFDMDGNMNNFGASVSAQADPTA